MLATWRASRRCKWPPSIPYFAAASLVTRWEVRMKNSSNLARVPFSSALIFSLLIYAGYSTPALGTKVELGLPGNHGMAALNGGELHRTAHSVIGSVRQ